MNILSILKQRFQTALAPLADDAGPLLEMIRPAQDPKFGDFQANCAMPLGKRLGRPPREIAEQIVAQLDVDDLCRDVEIAGPGFINLHLRDQWLIDQLTSARLDERLGVPVAAAPRTIIVDYSSPNVAKPMHVGHIRSTVIGDALCRTLRFLGHRVVADNHLGDWGTQFGMIIYGYKHFRDDAAYAQNAVGELARLYRLVRRLIDYHEAIEKLPQKEQELAEQQQTLKQQQEAPPPDDKAAWKKQAKALRKREDQLQQSAKKIGELEELIAEVQADAELAPLAAEHADIGQAVLQETVELHDGDDESLRLWHEFLPKCRDDIQRIYDRLDVRFDVEYGESFYHDQLAGVVDAFRASGLAQSSEGAMCVFLDGFDAPMIIQKRDGAFLYATTDLATIRYRMDTWNPDAILYVVDFRQGEHFDKLFAAAAKWLDAPVALRHVSFGTVLGDDGRPFRTRAGDTVGLEGLLDEAVRRALTIVATNDDAKPDGAELSDAQRQQIAETVGIAALKYADLAQNRTSDYVFSYDKMLAMNGNTATYLQYSYARVQGIFARGDVEIDQLRTSSLPIQFSHPAERALALQLLQFTAALDDTIADYRPNLLTSYLFELAKIYSTFFENCPVLKADDDALRTSRLLLCDLTARTIRQGLALLGIRVVDKM